MARQEEAESVDLDETIRRLVTEGRLTFSPNLNIYCHDCKKKIGAYRGKHFNLVPRNVDITVDADFLCDECCKKRNAESVKKEEQTKLGYHTQQA